jgi:hypothetical protein
MLDKKLYLIFGDNKDLGNILHSHYLYKCNMETQIKILNKISNIICDYNDLKFISLGYNKNSKNLIKELIAFKKEPNWDKIIIKFLKGLKTLLEREINKAKPLNIPPRIQEIIKTEIKKIPFYKKNSIVKISETKKDVITTNLLNLNYSPDYDPKKQSYYGKWEPWRDTQLIFKLNFNKNLFIWDYINVHKKFRGKRIGTNSAKRIEKFANKLGFTRFTVEYPNRKYWINKMNYEIPYKYRIGSGKYQYTHEGYKELK